MAINTDKNSYTILFAMAMVIVVGSLLAFTASSLKPNITKNKEIEKQQNILYAMGINGNEGTGDITFVAKTEAAEAFKTNVSEQIVLEVKDGEILKQMTRDEFMKSKAQGAGKEPYLIDIKKEQTKAKNGESRFLPLFKGIQGGKTVYVTAVRGKGLWDAIWGYIALDENMVIRGAFFDHAAETPGLGANIKQRYFMDDIEGEQLLSDSFVFKGIRVA
jgi:Na+-transporting NADH:ubiquinone oxidoreductase subunit C